jgi:Astacin (Peptidase family M12A)
MKAPGSRDSGVKKETTIRMCCDRILTGTRKIKAMEAALKENGVNLPPPLPKNHRRMGASSMGAPTKMAVMVGKKWKEGRTVGIYFMDGSKIQKSRVQEFASKWLKFANIKFNFAATRDTAEIRISFMADSGSWSYIGTDCLGIPKSEATMNFGWLRDDTGAEECERVVVHEFGHALGAIHEHQNPKGGIKWNTAAVYEYFSGPPNYWSEEDTDLNVLKKYSVDQLNASKFDEDSIMLYQFDGSLIQGGKPTKGNSRLSKGDKKFIKQEYPAV